MIYQETGRFGRITKNLRKQGFETEMEKILFDSIDFNKLTKTKQTNYIESVMIRMNEIIGHDKTNHILFTCGEQCCGKSWSNFAKGIWNNSNSQDDFFVNLNKEEEKFGTSILYNSSDNSITVIREKCICGLINKGEAFKINKDFCKCSNGHMSRFFNSVFSVKGIELKKSIFNSNDKCEWIIKLND
jgi:hypothetical protein